MSEPAANVRKFPFLEFSPEKKEGSRLKLWLLTLGACIVLAVGAVVWSGIGSGGPNLTERLLSQQVGPHTIDVFSKHPQLRVGENPLRIEVKDTATGRLVDVGTVDLRLNMDMPGMQMQADAVLNKSGQAGIYTGTIRPGMGGEWIAHLSYHGPKGGEQKALRLEVKR